ncbi:MAG: hypothetical protein J0H83_00355 [Candidatus Melainabacteria bacterium]|jgi:hypothetical protein|nr:hypothetical protein [Candidatus Melainabacteria bacterium]MBX9674923.1 hypothetical protein [Candidatus Obscuribacterales bacterium]
MSQTATVMDSALLEEVVHWVKTLTSVGVSPDKAAEITTDLLLAVNETSHEEEDYDMDGDFEDEE